MDTQTRQKIDGLGDIITRSHIEYDTVQVYPDTQEEIVYHQSDDYFRYCWPRRRKARKELKTIRRNSSDSETKRYISEKLRIGTIDTVRAVARPAALTAICVILVPVACIGYPLAILNGCAACLDCMEGRTPWENGPPFWIGR